MTRLFLKLETFNKLFFFFALLIQMFCFADSYVFRDIPIRMQKRSERIYRLVAGKKDVNISEKPKMQCVLTLVCNIIKHGY